MIMVTSNCALYGSKKSRIIKKQETGGILHNLTGIKVRFSVIYLQQMFSFKSYKMNAKVNKLLLAGNKFIPKVHLRQPGITYSAFEPFIKNKERIKEI